MEFDMNLSLPNLIQLRCSSDVIAESTHSLLVWADYKVRAEGPPWMAQMWERNSTLTSHNLEGT